MERVTREQWDQVRASLPRTPKQRPAPKPAQPGRSDWMPDSWKVVGLLVVACWPVAVWTGPVARWVALSLWWLFLVLFVFGAKYSGKR